MSATKRQYRWAQHSPKINPQYHNGIYCNGHPCQNRNWRPCRKDHVALSFKWSIATSHLLKSLPATTRMFKGCVSSPNQDANHWRALKKRFNKCRDKWERRTGYNLALDAKQHITIRRGCVDDGFADDMHYDFVAYTDAPSSVLDSELNEIFLGWIQAAGGNRSSSAFLRIDNTSETNLRRIANYTFKYPHEDLDNEHMLFKMPLPSTTFPVTWVIGNFWQRKPADVEVKYVWNGEVKEVTRRLSPLDQHWHEWITEVSTGKVPEFTTEEYRGSVSVARIAELIDGWGEFDPANKSNSEKEPIISPIRNVPPNLKNNSPILNENPDNSSLDPIPNNDVTKKTVQKTNNGLESLPRATVLQFNGYRLRRSGDGTGWRLALAPSSQIYSHDEWKWLDKTFTIHQVKQMVEGVGYHFERYYNPEDHFPVYHHFNDDPPPTPIECPVDPDKPNVSADVAKFKRLCEEYTLVSA